MTPDDLDLDMAATFTEVPMLVAEVRRLRARVRELEEALDEIGACEARLAYGALSAVGKAKP